MRLKYSFFLLFSFLFQKAIDAQQYKTLMKYDSINFYTVDKAAMQYFSTIDIKKKGSGYKEYIRWKVQNEPRFFPDGIRNKVSPYFAAEEYKKFINNNKSTRAILNKWTELGPFSIDTITGHYAAGLGRIEDVYVHAANPNIIYVGSRSGGFWKTTNGGNSWQGRLTDSLFASGVNCITASPSNPDSILINVRNADNGTSHGIYRSINGGNTWSVTNFNPTAGFGGLGTNFRINKIAYHPLNANIIFLCTSKGIFKSSNNLQTWTQLFPTADITAIAFHPTNANIIYIYDNLSGSTNTNNVLVTVNAGNSYTPSASLAGNSSAQILLSTTPACANCIFACSDNGVYKSIDSGKTFVFKSNPSQGAGGFAVHTADTTQILAGGVDMEQSFDGGLTFNQCTYWSLGSSQHNGTNNQSSYNNSQKYIHADCAIINCVNGVYYIGTDGFVCKSNDNGVSWTRIGNNLSVRENYCIGVSQSNHYVSMTGSQDNGESIKNKNGWIEFYGADGMESIVHPLNENWIVGSVQYGNRRRTKDGGYTQSGISPQVSDGYWVAPFAYSPLFPMTLYDFTDSIMRSDDFGDTWQFVKMPNANSLITQAAVSEMNKNTMVVASYGNTLQKTINGGTTFTNIKTGLPNTFITDIAFDPANDNNIAITYDNYNADGKKIYITKNGGTSWQNITYNLGNMPLQTVVIDHTKEKNIYVGAEIGVFVKAMADTVWALYQEGLPNVAVKELEINYGSNTIKAATWGRGLWENSLKNRNTFPAIITTSITNPPTMELPRIGMSEIVTSTISYSGNLQKVWVAFGTDSILLNNILPMTNTSDSTWKTSTTLPNTIVNQQVYFKVYAVGNNNDTTETYRFSYTVHPKVYCTATGNNGSGDLYIASVSLGALNAGSTNNGYSYTDNPLLELYPGFTYTITAKANTNWQENDFAAWIDFNGDRYFDEATEVVLYKTNIGQIATNTFTLPATYAAGDTIRLRVRLTYWDANPKPCGDEFGEVEDYLVMLSAPVAVNTMAQEEIKVVPNPTKKDITIVLPTEVNDIEIFNLQGQKVKQVKSISKQTTINVQNLPAGVYTIKASRYKGKFVKIN